MRRSKKNEAQPPNPVLILWWRPWVMGLSCMLLGWTAPAVGLAQAKPAAALPRQVEDALRRVMQPDSAATRAKFRPTEIEGLVVDQTITKVGHDFYDVFYTRWEAPPGASDFTVIIHEKPARGTATLVSVEVNDSEIMELPLQPKFDVVEAAAQDAVASVQEYLANYEAIRRQLDGADQSGSGIF
ncbi:hypothetical protein F0P96_18235 [Hymenobacter busanensis]|uniref:Curli production assembly/transport component CsgE n=1 Tax=Hymenobacter busanensis TaxID=2607656 RepID=A0A7L4ZUI9_9BACT|nr:CsgE family curli-type amyloid fiber assembly protein [Hymenobacter busanensis]KAA9327176.1 hypothetical protein F0P96_18235 [Hymenobacter busanensis]QHJ05842.1 hypothetical protein GUY19_00435 [Hymenobacter busanensis]